MQSQSIKLYKSDFEKTKLGIYFKENSHNSDLDQLREVNFIREAIHFKNPCHSRLYNDYYNIISEGMFNIIESILNDYTHIQTIDELIICFICINCNNYFLEKIITQKDFDINQTIETMPIFAYYHKQEYITDEKINLLGAAVITGKIPMIQFLIDHGANINDPDRIFISEICKKGTPELINFVVNCDIDDGYLHNLMFSSIFKNMDLDVKLIDNIIRKGYDISKNSEMIIKCVASKKLEWINFFLEHGLILDPSTTYPLDTACRANNAELVEFYLKSSLFPDISTINYVFYQMNIPIIKLFLKYDIDLSSISFTKTDHNDFITELETKGISKNTLLCIFMEIATNDKLYEEKIFPKMGTLAQQYQRCTLQQDILAFRDKNN